ncbi:Reactive oxygen species modulator 1 isoform X2 [Aix galericulata]|nr:Reactive oxygen species modulator 1 isoform X2 [Aix galericulata]
MPVTVGPYGQSQPSCFDRVKMGFMMGFAVGMAAGALFGTFSCLRIGMRGRELMGGVGKTMMQSGTELLEEAKAQQGTAAGTLLLLELEITNWYKQEKSSHHLTAEGLGTPPAHSKMKDSSLTLERILHYIEQEILGAALLTVKLSIHDKEDAHSKHAMTPEQSLLEKIGRGYKELQLYG